MTQDSVQPLAGGFRQSRFESIFAQLFDPQELKTLIAGLHQIGESQLAREFASALELLDQDGFFRHRNWHRVSPAVENEIVQIGDRIGNELWALDEKLVALLEKQESESYRDRQA